MNIFESIRNIWENLKLPEYAGLETPTGVESLTNGQLLELISAKISKGRSDLDRRLLAPWSEEFQYQFAKPETDFYRPEGVELLKERLAGLPIIELACGEQGALHSQIFCDVLGAESYHAVDRRTDLPPNNLVEGGDLLTFLERIPSSSSHIAAFGLFNEPFAIGDFIWPASSAQKASLEHLENEHLRRICREINRILPDRGLFFGSGIYPLGTLDSSVRHLQGAGVVEDSDFTQKMKDAGVNTDIVYGMFFYHKEVGAGDIPFDLAAMS